MTGPGLPTGAGVNNGAWYTFVLGSDLLYQLQDKDDAGAVKNWTTWSYEANRDLVSGVQNNWGSLQTYTTVSNYAYTNNNLALRTSVQYSGTAYGGTIPQSFGYNDRQELNTSTRSTTTWTYAYDPIGNRTTFEQSGQPQATYTANALDQYTLVNQPTQAATLKQSLEYDADGNLASAWKAGDMNCDGVVNFADIDAFNLAVTDRAAYEAQYPNCNWLNADCNGDGTVDFGDIDAFTALLTGGNEALAFTLVWDGENRLAERRPTFPDTSSQKVTCTYDYQGRRVEKKVYNWTGSQWQTTASLHRKFVWGGTGGSPASGWLLLMELDGLNGDAVLRKYTYGLDVASGASAGRLGLESAGTIGGVLATYDTNGTPGTTDDRTFVYCYDANGNVGQLIQTTAGGNYGTIAAKYEYDPYGARTNPPMIGEFAQPFRFSTKYFDAETGFLYFGGRYYQPSLGRWLNRDPIEEAGGPNLYGFAGNDPIDRIDPLGYVCGPRPEDCGGGAGGGGVPDSGPWACVKGDPSQDKPSTRPTGTQPTTSPTQPASQPGLTDTEKKKCCDAMVAADPRLPSKANAATMCCKGVAIICYFHMGRRWAGFDTCVTEHEEQHVADCKCKPGETNYDCGFTKPQGALSECKAYKKDLECLKKKKEEECGPPPLTPLMEECVRDYDCWIWHSCQNADRWCKQSGEGGVGPCGDKPPGCSSRTGLLPPVVTPWGT